MLHDGEYNHEASDLQCQRTTHRSKPPPVFADVVLRAPGVSCKLPPAPRYASWNAGGSEGQEVVCHDTATATCQAGYTQDWTTKTLTCTEDGSWDQELPLPDCERKHLDTQLCCFRAGGCKAVMD